MFRKLDNNTKSTAFPLSYTWNRQWAH